MSEKPDDSDVVEQALKEVAGRFRDWEPTPAMRGFARAVAYAAVEIAGRAALEQTP